VAWITAIQAYHDGSFVMFQREQRIPLRYDCDSQVRPPPPRKEFAGMSINRWGEQWKNDRESTDDRPASASFGGALERKSRNLRERIRESRNSSWKLSTIQGDRSNDGEGSLKNQRGSSRIPRHHPSTESTQSGWMEWNETEHAIKQMSSDVSCRR